MHKARGLANLGRLFACVPLILLISALGGPTEALQTDMDSVLKSDPRNNGIRVSVKDHAAVLTFNLIAVAPTNSMADVFRVFLQFAHTETSRQFKSAELMYRCNSRFILPGQYVSMN